MNLVEIGTIALAVIQIATIIARITPTPKDDEIVSKVGKVLNFIFLANNTVSKIKK
jgi:hypothetical protein